MVTLSKLSIIRGLKGAGGPKGWSGSSLLGLVLLLLSGCSGGDEAAPDEVEVGAKVGGIPEVSDIEELPPEVLHFQRGLDHSVNNNLPEAVREYKYSLEIKEEAPRVHLNLAFAYLDLNAIDLALIHMIRAIELAPDLENAYYGAAKVYERKGDLPSALKYWDWYLKLSEPGTKWHGKAKRRADEIRAELKG